MLSRRFRLTKQDNLSSILKSGKKAMGKFIVIRYRPNQEENNRYSVIISKKISKKATDRNQIRRQLYEQIRLSHNEESVQTQQFDILILPKKAIMDASTNHIQDDINSLLNTIR